MDDLYTDKDGIGFIFLVASKGNEERWYVKSVEASVQIDSVRVIEGVLVIGKTYDHTNGPLPNKEQIKKEGLELVRIETAKERFYLKEHPNSRRRLGSR